MNTNVKNFFYVSLLVGTLAGALSGCNTVEGAGKDIEAAGEEIQEEADENR